MVVGGIQDAAGPQAVWKAEIGVGQVGQIGAHEVEEDLPPDGRDLEDRTQLGSRTGPSPTPVPGDEIGLVTQQRAFFS